jgi:hypothetical protein
MHLESRYISDIALSPGLYTYYIERWKITGSVNIVELKYFFSSHKDASVRIKAEQAEQIINVASQKGFPGFEYYAFYNTSKAEESLKTLRNRCNQEYTRFVEEYSQRTTAFKEQREDFITRTFQSKIDRRQSLVDQMIFEGKLQGAKLNQAQIDKLKSTMESNLRENQEAKIAPSTTPIAIGIICII